MLQGEQRGADEERRTCNTEPAPCHPPHVCLSCWLCGLCETPARLGTIGGTATTLNLTALLCLGELWGRERAGGPSPPRSEAERPQVSGDEWGQKLSGRKDVLSPRSDPRTQGPDQAWSICDVCWGMGAHRELSPRAESGPVEPSPGK